ncbi:MAG: universal stress protein [Synechococcales cyanobacterium C42_A2020_086]|jgi:nucleotide-binding universal stress UspA family protein|nr:universal stress protein [Synechococcales cyanobacterium M58_A2018_015]MBF2072679.1 universal stress protein [Synechococcales cyanobacterium C42_A2020_086]
MLNKLLVAIDHSDLSWMVFDQALSLAVATAASLRVLHVVPPDEETVHDHPIYLSSAEVNVPGSHSSYEDALFSSYVSEALHAGVHTEFFQYLGNPGPIICNFALVWEADLIVIGRRGQVGFKDPPLGSVSSYVVHHAPCSVHLVHGCHSVKIKATPGRQVRAVY